MDVTGQENGAARPIGSLPAGTFEAEPEDLAAIFEAFRRYTRPSNVLSLAAAEKIVMRTTRYKDHLGLARRTVRYLQRRRILVDRRAGGVVWNDPAHPLTAVQIQELEMSPRVSAKAVASLPKAEVCRDFLLSLGRDASGAVRGTIKQLARRLEINFKLTSLVTFDLVNNLIDQGMLDLDPFEPGVYRVLRDGETVAAVEVAEAAPVAEVYDATKVATVAAPQKAREEKSVAKSTLRQIRVTPREEKFLVELMGRDRVMSFYTLARERLGSKLSAQHFHHLVVRRLGLLTPVVKGTGGTRSVHQVQHSVYDKYDFPVDSTLVRAAHEGKDTSAPQKEKVAKATRAPAAAAAPKVKATTPLHTDEDSPDAILARVERDLKAIEAEETKDRASYDARAKERSTRRTKLEAVRAKARELIELLRGTKF